VGARGAARGRRARLSQPFPPHPRRWLQYALWTLKTPFLLAQFVLLAGQSRLVFFTVVLFDWVMIGFGWVAQVQGDPKACWPLFSLGMMAQIGVFAIVYSRVQHGADVDPSARIYRFSFYWMFLTWNLVTLIMVLDKTGSISYDSKAIGYVITEFASTVVFALVTVGSREANEGLVTLGSRFAQAVVGDDSHLVSKSLAGGLSFGGSSLVTRTPSGV